jgi:hypothetical protein
MCARLLLTYARGSRNKETDVAHRFFITKKHTFKRIPALYLEVKARDGLKCTKTIKSRPVCVKGNVLKNLLTVVVFALARRCVILTHTRQ